MAHLWPTGSHRLWLKTSGRDTQRAEIQVTATTKKTKSISDSNGWGHVAYYILIDFYALLFYYFILKIPLWYRYDDTNISVL
jgi:hypothetical protein